MKKLFHRKKTSTPSSPDQTPPRTRTAGDLNGDPALRTSRYESTSSAALPQTGQYPLKGNNSAVALPGRRSETYSRGHSAGRVEPSPRPSTSTPYYGSLPAPRVTSASYDHQPSSHRLADRQSESDLANRSQRRQSARYSIPPVEDFSNLNLDSTQGQADYDDYPLRQHNGPSTFTPNAQSPAYPVTRHERPPYEEGNSSRFQHTGRTEPIQADGDRNRQPRNNARLEHGNQEYYDNAHGRHGEEYSSRAFGNQPEQASPRTGSRSISRKEVPPQLSTARNQSAHLPSSNTEYRSSVRDPQFEDYTRARQEEAFQPSPHVPKDLRSTPPGGRPSARDVVDRAKGNTYDTEVVEKIAPGMLNSKDIALTWLANLDVSAVVHETVHKNVHYVREEQITKEIHTHDVYHRILPIIDVEVLPPRHFLPVEGGGLVEISGKEVPGRGNNWVVAETASKIPSDQPAPQSLRPFSARQFIGTEGDAVRYQMPDGHERTEQTWVHPPELETGGRDTGQTWPMEFGNERPTKSSRSKSSKSNQPRKSQGAHSSTMQQPRT